MKRIGKNSLILLGIMAAVIIVMGLAVFLPQQRKLNAMHAEIITQKQAIEVNAAKASIVPEMVRQIQELKSRYTNFDRRLPKQKELGGFLREISGNLAQEHLANQLIEPGNPVRQELYHTLPIIMRFEGSYLSLAKFLDRIDSMERFTRVQRLVITPASGDRDKLSEMLNMELQMNIYFTES